MLKWLRKRSAEGEEGPSRGRLLRARVMRNPAVSARVLESGAMRLEAPRAKAGKAAARGRRSHKQFELDEMGRWLWERLDGRPVVETLIRNFATEHRVTMREAEVAILTFLKLLVKRNLAALAIPEAAQIRREGRDA